MDEMMRGQRGWRELAILGDKIDKVSGVIEGLIWSPKAGDVNNGEKKDHFDDWPSEEVIFPADCLQQLFWWHIFLFATYRILLHIGISCKNN